MLTQGSIYKELEIVFVNSVCIRWGVPFCENTGLRRSCGASAPARKALPEETRSVRTPGSDFCQTSGLKYGICLLCPRGIATSMEKVKPAFFLSEQAPEVKLIFFNAKADFPFPLPYNNCMHLPNP